MAYCFFENYLIRRKIHIWEYLFISCHVYFYLSLCISIGVCISTKIWLASLFIVGIFNSTTILSWFILVIFMIFTILDQSSYIWAEGSYWLRVGTPWLRNSTTQKPLKYFHTWKYWGPWKSLELRLYSCLPQIKHRRTSHGAFWFNNLVKQRNKSTRSGTAWQLSWNAVD